MQCTWCVCVGGGGGGGGGGGRGATLIFSYIRTYGLEELLQWTNLGDHFYTF